VNVPRLAGSPLYLTKEEADVAEFTTVTTWSEDPVFLLEFTRRLQTVVPGGSVSDWPKVVCGPNKVDDFVFAVHVAVICRL